MVSGKRRGLGGEDAWRCRLVVESVDRINRAGAQCCRQRDISWWLGKAWWTMRTWRRAGRPFQSLPRHREVRARRRC